MLHCIKEKILSSLQPTISIPPHLKKNFIDLSSENLEELKNYLITYYFSKQIYDFENYLNTEEGKNDLNNHLQNRLNRFRHTYIVFLNHLSPSLENKTILEIGCGTGASTVAIAEQKPQKIISIDIDENALIVARKRTELYGLSNIEFRCMNATAIHQYFTNSSFDIIIFFATFEHLTIEERIQSLKSAYDLLKSGGYLLILEAPNRLWCFDHHTSFLPFYHWLPPELAILYSQYINRKIIREKMHVSYFPNQSHITTYYRLGTGVSYHELELSVPNLDLNTQIRGLMELYNFPFLYKWTKHLSFNYKYKKLIQKINNKTIHPSLYEPFIDIAIYKP